MPASGDGGWVCATEKVESAADRTARRRRFMVRRAYRFWRAMSHLFGALTCGMRHRKARCRSFDCGGKKAPPPLRMTTFVSVNHRAGWRRDAGMNELLRDFGSP